MTFDLRTLTFELRHAQFCRNKRFCRSKVTTFHGRWWPLIYVALLSAERSVFVATPNCQFWPQASKKKPEKQGNAKTLFWWFKASYTYFLVMFPFLYLASPLLVFFFMFFFLLSFFFCSGFLLLLLWLRSKRKSLTERKKERKERKKGRQKRKGGRKKGKKERKERKERKKERKERRKGTKERKGRK